MIEMLSLTVYDNSKLFVDVPFTPPHSEPVKAF